MIFLPLILTSLIATAAISVNERANFLKHLTKSHGRPATFVSFMQLQSRLKVNFYKVLSKDTFVADPSTVNFNGIFNDARDVFVADLKYNITNSILTQASKKQSIKSPSRWVLFYKIDIDEMIKQNSNPISDYDVIEKTKEIVGEILNSVHIGINSEVYVAFEVSNCIFIFLVYKITPEQPLIWQNYAKWQTDLGFDRTLHSSTLSVRRKDIQGRKMVAAAVITDDNTLDDMKDFRRPIVDVATKLSYYLVIHLFEWLNASGVINATDTWGYQLPNGTYNGIMKELHEKRSDISGNMLFLTQKRMDIVEYVMSPSSEQDGLYLPTFILLKPSLATITNIYALPFSRGVWICLLLLLVLSSVLLYLASFKEVQVNLLSDKSLIVRFLQCFHDTFCLVFQQGTAHDPISLCCRQILLLGLLSFMFLYTAYSAKVVALLQSTTNDINSIDALLRSPVQIGAHDTIYNKHYFNIENRPIHRELFVKKGLTQGENFYVSLEEGIRRVKQGLYAFHAEANVGLELIQQTYQEHEKCKLAFIRFMPNSDPHFAIRKDSDLKEQLRVGAIRIKESGLQTRAVRRFVLSPKCDSSMAFFTAVNLQQVAPAFKCMVFLYGCAIAVLVSEILYRKFS